MGEILIGYLEEHNTVEAKRGGGGDNGLVGG